MSKPRPYHVLVTGFGPFSHYTVNPSWLAVKPLHNTVLKVDVPTEPVPPGDQALLADTDACVTATREIHITVLQVPVTYDAVLSIVPGLHARPPILPPTADLARSPPLDGYDLFFHVGVMGSEGLQVERVGHKFGYNKEDATGALAPVVDVSRDEGNPPPEAQLSEGARLGDNDNVESPTDGNDTPTRGFGKGYESFAEEIHTEVDVEKLVHHLKRCGVQPIRTSMDTGHYLCDFLYYCSLAECKRSSAKNDKSASTSRVLFLHCPPIDLSLSTEEVTDAIKTSVMWLCSIPTS
ncbi:hypothetical protein ID866_8452 [Astraeus odoratus]|nr:hypothetical protein ID866_8452 [Astraeus odoratus]